MADSSVDICNSALLLVGAESISSLSDNTKAARLCNTLYDKRRRNMLRGYRWRFARRRTLLDRHFVSITNANISTADDTLTFSQSGLFSPGDKIEILSVSGAGTDPTITGYTLSSGTYGEFFVRPDSLTSIKIYATEDGAVDDTDAIVISNAGTKGLSLKFLEKKSSIYTHVFAKPSDMLRPIIEEDKLVGWSEENGVILTDDKAPLIEYIADVENTTMFDQSFDEALAVDIAMHLAYPLVQSLSLKKDLQKDLRAVLADARSFSAQSGTPESFEADLLINSRL